MRLVFDSIVQASKLVRVGRFDDEAELESEFATLARAYRLLDADQILTAAFEDERSNLTGYYANVQDFYTNTEAQLSGVHSPDGAVHFGLDWDGRFRREGFYEQARIVEEVIKRNAARDVLEIGPGKGFNIVYLAQRNRDVRFKGVDLTPHHLRIASERGQGLTNLRLIEGDFHRLTEFPDDSLDVAFDVEAGVHSDTPERLGMLFSELHRVLRPGGLFVTFTYYRANDFDRFGKRARLAVELVERAWVIKQFHRESAWKEMAHAAGLELTEQRDLREAVMPSIVRLYRQARMFYLCMAGPMRPLIAKLVRRSTHNAVSMVMLPYALGFGALEYRMAVLQKPGS